ncbi:pyridoxal phosphate-dependent decarboxylase family protein [Brevibacterium marinum]|uniref:Glutamate/tyrosine decarboxylase-like PLP-dependent enzyme n=1 Tax=Brevibacterium marinum TaxID=418643 RepID=A0A846RZ59_9MICO|nr:aminotransferase class V-fold PLP-dependent enzyme [Brevibacterium marinum]NJC55963.1 glutamate/tyrosine decarboxylase-like PLP-dependent enzyme [Brevibacterium marinum]
MDETMRTTDLDHLLGLTASLANDFLAHNDDAEVSPALSLPELRDRFSTSLPESGCNSQEVIETIAREAEPGVLRTTSGRFFGWVIGGSHLAALAADWMVTAWDQNAALYSCGPAVSVIEEVAGEWVKQLLGLPREASVAFTSGAQMAHATALAAARNNLLHNRGWDAEYDRLAGSPQIRVLCSGEQHASIERACRLLGFGTASISALGTDDHGLLDTAALESRLSADPSRPSIVILQAGEINTGSFAPFREACRIAHDYGAWVHIDGAFGLWAGVSPHFRHLLDGATNADSWTTDAHKWLNVPFDNGVVVIRDRRAHRAAMSIRASYLVHSEDPADAAPDAARDQIDWNPEWSRRARGVPVYATIRALGRVGITEIVERTCRLARRLAGEIGDLPSAELLVDPVINQGLVRFRSQDGHHDARTEPVIDRLQSDGTAWFGGTDWQGKRVMRISVVNWQSTDDDISQAVGAVADALEHA